MSFVLYFMIMISIVGCSAGDKGNKKINFKSPDESASTAEQNKIGGETPKVATGEVSNAKPQAEWNKIVSSQVGIGLATTVYEKGLPPERDASDPLAPGQHIVSSHCMGLLHQVWPERTKPDLNHFHRCIDKASDKKIKLPDGRTVPQMVTFDLPPNYLDPNGDGSKENPYNKPYLPAWMDSEEYVMSFEVPEETHYYWGLRWKNFGIVLNEYLMAIGKEFNGNPSLGLVRLNLGFQGETQPNKPCQSHWTNNTGCPDSETAVFSAHEKLPGASCTDYITFMEEAAKVAVVAFSKHDVVIMANPSPCAGTPGWRFRRDIFTKFKDNNIRVGYSANSIHTDFGSASAPPGTTTAGFGAWDTGLTVKSWGMPVTFEYWPKPTYDSSCSNDPIRCKAMMVWIAMSGYANGGSRVLHFSSWNSFYSAALWDVNDYVFNDQNRAFLWFRKTEFPIWKWTKDYGQSGTLATFGRYIKADLEPFIQACSAPLVVRAKDGLAVVNATNKPNIIYSPCPEELPAPATPLTELDGLGNWQALGINAPLKIILEGHPAQGKLLKGKMTLTYFDQGSGKIAIKYPISATEQKIAEIDLSNSGHWLEFKQEDAIYFDNISGVFMEITPSIKVFMHEIKIDPAK